MPASTSSLSLVAWAMTNLVALYAAQNQTALLEAYGSFVDGAANITFNGIPMNTIDYMSQFSAETFLERNCSISFLGSVSSAVGSTGNETESASTVGMVGLFYSVTVIENLLLEGAPLIHVTNSSINLQYVLVMALVEFYSFSDAAQG